MFRTELPLTPHPQQLPLSAHVLTVGSCFSDTIGGRLAATKVKTLVNPFGTVFNPLSACQLLRAAAGEEMDWQQHLVEARGRWQSYDLHASIGADSPVTLLQQIQELVRETGEFLQTTDVVLLTLGTAYAYRLQETDDIVSNCHKIPAERFEKVLLTPDEIINAVAETHAYLRRANPKLRFILTVSPVRHLKDTLPLNAVSKSVLRVACHYLSELLPDVSYFPAYELLLDDLRDYRFYASDMLHPSETAENYIWERFTRTYFDSSFGRFRREWESVRQALGHRPLYEAAPEHRAFLESTLERLQKLAGQADVQAETQEVQRQLAALPLPKVQPLPEPEPDDDEERIDIGELATPPQYEAAAAVMPPVPAPVEVAAQEERYDEPEATETDDEDDLEENAAEEGFLETDTAAFPKKKRRSRGGAKRTARKKAAQLYAQQAAEAAAATVSEPVESLISEEVVSAAAIPAPTLESSPAPIAEPVSTPEPVAEVPVAQPEPTSTETPQPKPAAPEDARPKAPARVPYTQTKAEPKADWLQLMDDADDDEEIGIPQQPAPKAPAQNPAQIKAPTRGRNARPVPEKKPRATKDRIITTPPRSGRRKPALLYAEAADETVTPATATVIPEVPAVAVPETPQPAAELVAPVTTEAPVAAAPVAVPAAPAAMPDPVATPAPEVVEAAAAGLAGLLASVAKKTRAKAAPAKAASSPKAAAAKPKVAKAPAAVAKPKAAKAADETAAATPIVAAEPAETKTAATKPTANAAKAAAAKPAAKTVVPKPAKTAPKAKKPAAEVAPTATIAPAAAEAPKKRSRPPRKKPAADADTASDS